MAEFNPNSSTTTNLAGKIPDFIVNARKLDTSQSTGEEEFWYFDKAMENFGYYFEIPEINCAANALATWTVSRGWKTDNTRTQQILEHVTGMGKDTFTQIMWNHEVTKLVVGDAFIELKWKENISINMIPISPERVRIVHKDGRIVRYETWNGKEWKSVSKENMLHSSNKRIGDQIHGTSQIDACKWIINARNETLIDWRKIEHRGVALGIAYYKTDNVGKITFANTQIEKAVGDGEMLGLPEGVAEIREFPTKSIGSRLEFVQYLENFFYQVFGVPRSIATSDGTSEVGGKMGHVIFEPIYTKEQVDLENDLWNQAYVKLKFNRPPSLGGLVAQEENKNTGMTSIQPNDVSATMNRE